MNTYYGAQVSRSAEEVDTIGDNSDAIAPRAIAVGYNALTSGASSIAIGSNTIGSNAIAKESYSTIINNIDQLVKIVEQLQSDMAAIRPLVEYARDRAATVIQRAWLKYRYAPGSGIEYKKVEATTLYRQRKLIL